MRFIVAILLVLFFQTEARSAELKIDIAVVPPMVTKFDGAYSGFDIELWEAIANELELSFEYHEVPFSHIFSGVKKKESDLAFAGITITEEREKFVDLLFVPFDDDFEMTVFNIAHKSFEMKRLRIVPRKRTEADALHKARENQTRAKHVLIGQRNLKLE